jgi:hypothetical protein
MVLLFLSTLNYLIDSYTIFAASVLAASSVLRSTFGAVFPLFTTQMYGNLGIHWASSIPAFLALACLPFPFLFYKYGESIRLRCKYAAEADRFMQQIRGQTPQQHGEPDLSINEAEDDASIREEKEEESEQEAFDNSWKDIEKGPQPHKSHNGLREPSTVPAQQYNEDPYTIDRVNTRESFRDTRSRSNASSKTENVTKPHDQD